MSSPETLLRQITMLRHIPIQPRKISVLRLLETLVQHNYNVDLRTVQRDLNKLSLPLPIIGDGEKPQGWSWNKDAAPLTLSALDPQSALMFNLVEQYISPLLPASTLECLKPWFRAATGVLDEHSTGLADWPGKIRVLPQGQRLLTPPIDSHAQSMIYRGLLEEHMVQIEYQRRGADQAKTSIICPLALVVRDGLIYLVCTYSQKQKIFHLALHRVISAQVLDEKFIRPEDFNIDQHINKGGFDFPLSDDTLLLEAEFTARVAGLLKESPLSLDQTITPFTDNTFIVKSTVHNTRELRWWLQSFGAEVTVISPESLRNEFKNMAKNLLQQYSA